MEAISVEDVAKDFAMAALSAAAVAVFASLAPAWPAARLNVVEAIGYE